jgi:hypothetical protein
MKTMFTTLKVSLGLAVIVACLFPLIHCGGVTDAQTVADPPANEPIVGFWYYKMESQGNTGLGIPDGVVLDSGYAQWHSDGTEISNSNREPVTQSFCLGVWEKSGGLHYQLNHFAISWLFSGTETYQGPANIGQTVTVSQDHNSFTGTFTIKQYDPLGSEPPLVSLTGNIEGHRITITTPVQDVLPVPPPPAP